MISTTPGGTHRYRLCAYQHQSLGWYRVEYLFFMYVRGEIVGEMLIFRVLG